MTGRRAAAAAGVLCCAMAAITLRPDDAAAQDRRSRMTTRTAVTAGLTKEFAERLAVRPMPLRDVLERGLAIEVTSSRPVSLVMFHAVVDQGRVTAAWWSTGFRAAAGVSPFPGERYLPDGIDTGTVGYGLPYGVEAIPRPPAGSVFLPEADFDIGSVAYGLPYGVEAVFRQRIVDTVRRLASDAAVRLEDVRITLVAAVPANRDVAAETMVRPFSFVTGGGR